MPTVNEILKQKVVSYFPSNRRMRISVFRTFFNELIDAITNQTQTILTTMVFLVGPKYKIGSKELLTPNKKQEDFNRWITDVNLAQYNEIQELKSKLACITSYLNITCSGSSGSGSNSGSGGSGIGGTLLEAWANPLIFNITSLNTFFSGSVGFSNVKAIKFEGSIYVKFDSFGFTDFPNATVEIYNLGGQLMHTGNATLGNTTSQISFNNTSLELSAIDFILIKVGVYNNGLTNGQTRFDY